VTAISQATVDLVHERSGGACEVCGAARATNLHHRRARGMGGTKAPIHGPEWLLHLCGTGTTGCHGYIEAHPETSYAKGWKLRRNRDPAISPVQLGGQWVILTPDGGREEHRWSPSG
jgi:hypothetical protein